MKSSNLTVGKIRGLSSTSTSNDVFTILAFDHRQSFAKMLPNLDQRGGGNEQIVSAKVQVVRALSPHVSSVLLDPEFGAAQMIARRALPGNIGLVVALEETGYGGSGSARTSRILPGWSVNKVKRMGADAVKLLIYYHPNAGEVTESLENLTINVVDQCRQADIALFLEPVTYSIDPQIAKNSAEFAALKPEIILETAHRLGNLGPDVLKMEFPVDSNINSNKDEWERACEALSQAAPCPWTVLSAGVGFDLFAQQVEVACRCGASGYIGGRAIWKEGISMPPAERETWLNEVAARRLDTLGELAAKYSRPWSDFFPKIQAGVGPGWYHSYDEY